LSPKKHVLHHHSFVSVAFAAELLEKKSVSKTVHDLESCMYMLAFVSHSICHYPVIKKADKAMRSSNPSRKMDSGG